MSRHAAAATNSAPQGLAVAKPRKLEAMRNYKRITAPRPPL